jgi:serpin B
MKLATGITTVLALAALIGSASSREREPAVPAADTAAVAKGNNQFALDLYNHLRATEGNQFLSPYSISTALAMTYTGARGQTAGEMAKVLHFTLDQKRLHPAFQALLAQASGTGKKEPPYQLSVANALWGQKGYGFLPEFLNTTRANYGAPLNEVDFVSDAPQAVRVINEWVELQTRDKIKKLLQSGDVNADTRLVLTNAIYFKGNWADKFSKKSTRDAQFHVTADRAVKVPTMHRTDEYRYLDGGSFQALELPYAGRHLAMLVLLPEKVNGLAALEKQLSEAWLAKQLPRLQSQEVIVALPRFMLTRRYELANALGDMGMPSAFDPARADFSGMSGSTKKLFVSAVVHKAFVEVNEEGTEAAGATGVVLKKEAAEPHRPVEFRADHPFLFLIRDNRSGSILFLGRLANPKD